MRPANKKGSPAVLQATRLTKDFYLLVVNRALCHLNDCHLPVSVQVMPLP